MIRKSKQYVASVYWRNEGQLYATESYVIQAPNKTVAKALAIERTELSMYNDSRIPDRQRHIMINIDGAL